MDRSKADEICRKVMSDGKQLTEKGHICVKYYESYPLQLGWCGNTVKCESITKKEQNAIKEAEKKAIEDKITPQEREDAIKKNKLNKSIEAFAEGLKLQGHKCIVLIDKSPYVEWCNKYSCENV
jgi:hypothetical protein